MSPYHFGGARYDNDRSNDTDRDQGYDLHGADAFEEHGFVPEYVATTYLANYAPGERHSAELLAADGERGVFAFEDLLFGRTRTSLVDASLYDDALAAEAALTAQAQALARLHVATVDCRSKHAEVYRALLARNNAPDITWPICADGAAVGSVFADTWPESELAAVEARLADPGPRSVQCP